MPEDSKTVVNEVLAALPSPAEIRRRIAENHQERQLLRQLLKLAEQRANTEGHRDE